MGFITFKCYYSHMTGPLSIALSGMTAASTRANAAASNIANAHTTGARKGVEGPAPYAPVDIVQSPIGIESGLHGTRAETVLREPATTPIYQPDASYADADGFVAAPNVDLITETIDLKNAAQAYKASAAVARVASEMDRALLNRFDETA